MPCPGHGFITIIVVFINGLLSDWYLVNVIHLKRHATCAFLEDSPIDIVSCGEFDRFLQRIVACLGEVVVDFF